MANTLLGKRREKEKQGSPESEWGLQGVYMGPRKRELLNFKQTFLNKDLRINPCLSYLNLGLNIEQAGTSLQNRVLQELNTEQNLFFRN